MNPLASLFGAVVRARNEFYDRGTLTVHRLRWPVVSIGNLSVGGTGKTPFLMLLGELLSERGVDFDVLSRGYRRQTTGVVVVDPEGSAQEFGDEPLLIARRLKVPVIVGEDRFAAGQVAEQKFGPRLHLLDDGFQHRRLARDFDIVLVTPQDTQDSLLPTGRLREPLTALQRADAVVLAEGATSDALPLQNQQVWRVQRDLSLPRITSKTIAFCGIARPERFFSQLQSRNVELAVTKTFRDHHAYTEDEVRELLTLRKQHSAQSFVTTEKDMINLGQFSTRLEPIYVATVCMQLENADAALDAVLAAIGERNQRPS